MPATNTRRTLILAGLSAIALSACGFRMRGPQPLPFETIYVGNLYHALGGEFRRQIEFSGNTKVVQTVDDAQVRLDILRDNLNREILSLAADGSVREYELERTLVFRVLDGSGRERLPASMLRARRDYGFSDSRVLSAANEEALLLEDMERDILRQLVRRLAVVRP